MKRLALTAAVGAILVGCGSGRTGEPGSTRGSSSAGTVVLRYETPDQTAYLRMRGPAAAVTAVGRVFAHHLGTITAVPSAHGPRDCSRSIRFPAPAVDFAAQALRKFAGQKVTLDVYGVPRTYRVALLCSRPRFALQLMTGL